MGRFTTIDPLAEKYYSVSPYAYCGNNFVNRIDPTGMIWEDQKEADVLKTSIQETEDGLDKDKLQTKLDNKDNPLSDKQRGETEAKKADIDAMKSSLEISKGNIDALKADNNHTYDLVNADGEMHNVIQGTDGIIKIEGSNDALYIHEIDHVAKSLRSNNGLQFSDEGLLMPSLSPSSGRNDEIAAYRAQYAFSPWSLPSKAGSINDINLEWVATLRNSSGQVAYPAINQIWVNYQISLRKAGR